MEVNGHRHEDTAVAEVYVCPFCGGMEHNGTFACPRIAYVKFHEDGETPSEVGFHPPATGEVYVGPETDASYRRRLLVAVGGHSVNRTQAETASGAELDRIGAFYDVKRRGA